MQLGVELGDDGAAPHFVEVVVDTDHFCARGVRAVQVDRDEITVDGWSIDDLELRVVLTQSIDLLLDLFLLDHQTGEGDLKTVVAGMATSGRTWTTASNETAPWSSPPVMSISGCAIGSSSVSTTARA